MYPCMHASIHPSIHASIHPSIHPPSIHTYIHIYKIQLLVLQIKTIYYQKYESLNKLCIHREAFPPLTA